MNRLGYLLLYSLPSNPQGINRPSAVPVPDQVALLPDYPWDDGWHPLGLPHLGTLQDRLLSEGDQGG